MREEVGRNWEENNIYAKRPIGKRQGGGGKGK